MSANGTYQGIRSIVERARAGDQVAMALITETARQAGTGNKRAQRSRKYIEAYIKKHPASSIAGDSQPSVNTNPAAQMAVWRAQTASPEQFAAMVAKAAPHVGPWQLVSAIYHGPTLQAGAPLMLAASVKNSKIAACVRRAFRLQRLADARVPISSYCRNTASELGE